MNNSATERPAAGRLFDLLEAVAYAEQHDDVVVRFEGREVRITTAHAARTGSEE